VSEEVFAAASAAAARWADLTGHDRHDVAVVLGSGWARAADALGPPETTVPATLLPGFVAPTVEGHAGIVSSVAVGSHRVAVFAGRSHLYEGHPASVVVHAVRTAVLAGCRAVILTNAAGSLRPEWEPGRLVLVADHLNLTGASPVVGAIPPPHPGRFVDLSTAYSPRLRAIARAVDPSLAEGVYAAVLGGAFETPAEIRMLRTMGADLVGMSTALETIAAVHLGAEVLGLSLVTNLAAGLGSGPLAADDVFAAARDAAAGLGARLSAIVGALPPIDRDVRP
jgi:purine-nucleoside phosphorylase